MRRGWIEWALALSLVTIPQTASSAAKESRSTRRVASTQLLEVDHLIIGVQANAPERAALERAGFTIAPDVNRHDGQGSASMMVELANGFLELAWRDDSVSVNPGLEKVAERFQRQGDWRSSGWSPFSIGLRRLPGVRDSLPFPTRVVRAEWMYPGAHINIISAAADTLGPRLFVTSAEMVADGNPDSESERARLAKTATFVHANGVKRITGVRVTAPASGLTPSTELVARTSPVVFRRGASWLLEVTFDHGARRKTRDLRPELPLLVHF